MNNSNLQGRLFEKLIFEEIKFKLREQSPHSNTKEPDNNTYQPVGPIENSMKRAAEYYVNNILPNYIQLNEITSIQMLSDLHGQKGNPTDIQIQLENSTYNISLKHNHEAVKHQRPGALFRQLGVTTGEAPKLYRQKLSEIFGVFYNNCSQDEFTFKEVKIRDSTIIDSLYFSVCNLVSQTINLHQNNADQFFRFLVGIVDFDKVIYKNDSFNVMRFSGIKSPTKMNAQVRSNNYIYLTFDNGFEFSMRLHTASSKFERGKSISLKFDTQLTKSDINTDNYNIT